MVKYFLKSKGIKKIEFSITRNTYFIQPLAYMRYMLQPFRATYYQTDPAYHTNQTPTSCWFSLVTFAGLIHINTKSPKNTFYKKLQIQTHFYK